MQSARREPGGPGAKGTRAVSHASMRGVRDTLGGASVRPNRAKDCSHGWSPAQPDGTRGVRGTKINPPRRGGGTAQPRLHRTPPPRRGGRVGARSRPTGCALPAWRRTALHPWLQSRVSPGPSLSREIGGHHTNFVNSARSQVIGPTPPTIPTQHPISTFPCFCVSAPIAPRAGLHATCLHAYWYNGAVRVGSPTA